MIAMWLTKESKKQAPAFCTSKKKQVFKVYSVKASSLEISEEEAV